MSGFRLWRNQQGEVLAVSPLKPRARTRLLRWLVMLLRR
jgi:hypothetical protein